uniref:Receptor ligand binding region domain-containing protein n=1 Tax=Trichogramma kaykai TaxID=54128 RepID=A0ABD2XQE3_9HYME
MLKQIRNSAESHIILDCSVDKIYTVLKQAQEIGMMTDYHSYFITSLDLHTIDLNEFKYGGTNITGFRMIKPDSIMINPLTKNTKIKANHLSNMKVIIFKA